MHQNIDLTAEQLIKLHSFEDNNPHNSARLKRDDFVVDTTITGEAFI
jgi:hypothetical protein